jgi:hypothetical protein
LALEPRQGAVVTTDLSFDKEQLAAALERVGFSEDDVLSASRDAQHDGAAQVGVFPQQGEAQFHLHPVLTFRGETAVLHVVAFNMDVDPTLPEHTPEFTVVLKTTSGEVLTSHPEAGHEGWFIPVVSLNSSRDLIGARLELVA